MGWPDNKKSSEKMMKLLNFVKHKIMNIFSILVNSFFLLTPVIATPSNYEKTLQESHYFEIDVVEAVLNKYGIDIGDKKYYQFYSYEFNNDCNINIEVVSNNNVINKYIVDLCHFKYSY